MHKAIALARGGPGRDTAKKIFVCLFATTRYKIVTVRDTSKHFATVRDFSSPVRNRSWRLNTCSEREKKFCVCLVSDAAVSGALTAFKNCISCPKDRECDHTQ
jgi:hypothetical protein